MLCRAIALLLSPWIGNACRFEPTCSAYALQALESHGAAAGSYLDGGPPGALPTVVRRRLDPVPAEPPRLFTWLLASSSEKKPYERYPPHHLVGDLWLFHGPAVGQMAIAQRQPGDVPPEPRPTDYASCLRPCRLLQRALIPRVCPALLDRRQCGATMPAGAALAPVAAAGCPKSASW